MNSRLSRRLRVLLVDKPRRVRDLPWWGYVLTTLALTHVTIAAVTIFLHRCQAHRAWNLHRP